MRARFPSVTMILTASPGAVAGGAYGWRRQGRQDEKLKNRIEAMPGAANLTFETGERYKSVYWAVRQEKWEFAAYQAQEMKDLLETPTLTRPKRAETARGFLEHAYPVLKPALTARDWPRFTQAFEHVRQACMTCPIENHHAFIKLPLPAVAASPVLNID